MNRKTRPRTLKEMSRCDCCRPERPNPRDAKPPESWTRAEAIADRVKVRGRGGTILQPGIELLEKAEDFPERGPVLVITDGFCDRLHLGRPHAFLLPRGRHLPFVPKGQVFRIAWPRRLYFTLGAPAGIIPPRRPYTLKAPTLFTLIFILATALGCPRFTPQARAQTRDAGRVRAGGAATRSTVRGRVVYADTGNPVRRAEVVMTNALTGERVGEAVANVKGEFGFDELPAGRYAFLALAPSLVDPYAVSGSDAAAELLDEVEWRDGLAEVEVDGNRGADIMLRARRGGAITGRVTYEDGEPVADAQLRLFRLRQGQLARVASTWETYSSDRVKLKTDSRGVYRVAGLPAGEYIVRVSESRLNRGAEVNEGEVYGDGSLVVTYFPSAVSVKHAAAVRVYEGRDTERVDIRIPERATRRLGGTVTLKRGGSPVAGAEIVITRRDEGASLRRLSGDESARSDMDGKWEVSGVPDGEYFLTVNSITAYVATATKGTRGVNVLPLKREVTVAGADLSDLRLEAKEGGRVSGTVTVEGGRELPDFVRIEALRDGESVDTTFTGEGGKFELDGVPPGEIRFRVSGFPDERFYVKALSRNRIDLRRDPVRVGQGARVEGVSVVLAADLAILKGQALARHDATSPLAHAWVVFVTADEKLRRAGDLPRVVRADARGRFEIAAGPGEYFLAAMPGRDLLSQNFRLDEDYIRRSQPALTRVTLKAGVSVSGVKVLGAEK